MIESIAVRKHKIALVDYDYKRDIENRLVLSNLTSQEHAVLEEILFSPIRTSVRKIAKSIDIPEDAVLLILQKLSKTGLIALGDDAVIVDKETRKYFETEMEKFEADFQGGMEFFQSLLKKVPIHVLPQWYAIPRTSNNIFDSLIEKYLLTPLIYQRYLIDLHFSDPTLSAIVHDVLKDSHFEVSGQEIQKKYNLSPEKFQELMLTLEFHCVCLLAYRKQRDGWYEVVTLFHEWKEYLTFLKETEPSSIADPKKVVRYRPHDFSFVDDMTAVLLHLQKEPCFLKKRQISIQFSPPLPGEEYLKKLLLKIEQLQLAQLQNGNFVLTSAGSHWLSLRAEDKALYLYRHPLNQPHPNEKVVREIEKSILRIVHLNWVRLSDFMKSVCVPIAEGQAVALKKTGKSWKYQRPNYTPDDLKLIEKVVLDHLFEAGVIVLGMYQKTACIAVTPFGQSLFG